MSASARTQPCTGRNARKPRTVALPLAPGRPPPLRHSRASKWRAFSLILVHVAMVAHFVHWRIAGRTLTPVEPSEAMYTLRDGALNAGFIFFSAAILATLVLGRFFCGWGCHLVAYQDLCGWVLRKLRLRPKQFRSRYMMLIPLAAAIYMFILPLIERLYTRFVRNVPPPKIEPHLLTTGFWDTFAGPIVAVPFLLVCGVVIVYFLGNKAFCAYGCPYGAFFGLADKLATGRIRVTDACEGCGHCTAVCTSNVHVSEEVRRFGMVVDPGCMKCMDCVTVCPNDALYFGFGRLPVGEHGHARGADPASPARSRADVDFAKRAGRPRLWKAAAAALMSALITLLLVAVMWGREARTARVPADFLLISGITIVAGVWVILMLVRLTHARGEVHYDLTRGGELGALVVFSIAFLAFRGIYDGAVPFLFGLGIGAVAAYLAVQAWRLTTNRAVVMQRWKLKADGRLTRAGWVFAAAISLLTAWTAHSALWQWHDFRCTDWYADARPIGHPDRRAAAEAALPHLEWCRDWGLFPVAKNLMSLAWAEVERGRLDAARSAADAATRAFGSRSDDPRIWLEVAKLHTWRNDDAAARAAFARAIDLERGERERLAAKVPDARHPTSALVWREWGNYLARRVLPPLMSGDADARERAADERRRVEGEIARSFENAARFDPASADALMAWGEHLLRAERIDDARPILINAVRAAPHDPRASGLLAVCGAFAQDDAAALRDYDAALEDAPNTALLRRNRALVHARRGRLADAGADYREALRLNPGSPDLRIEYGDLLAATNDLAGAAAQFEAARAMRGADPGVALRLGAVYERQNRRDVALAAYRQAAQSGDAHIRESAELGLNRLSNTPP